MKLKILLINPWIYDFAAVNLWSRPLGLLKVAECLSKFEVELRLIDCMDILSSGRSGRGKYPKETVERPECLKSVPRRFGRYGITVDEFKRLLKETMPFDAVLVTSIMSWWYPGVQEVIGAIKSVSKNIPVILGGIYATLWTRHALENSGADFIYTGQAGDDLRIAFNTFGFRLKRAGEDVIPWYRLGLYRNYTFAPLITASGCPFNCPYCASTMLHDLYEQRPPDLVVREIADLYGLGAADFAFYDDALLVDADLHIKTILKEVISSGMDIRFHCPNGLHARFIDDELAFLMKKSGFMTIRLSLETIDPERQKSTGGKVTSKDLAAAVSALKRYGFTRENIGVYLMYGLPGQDIGEVKEGVDFLKSLEVKIKLTEFSPIPGTACWDDLVMKGVISSDIDPLLTNNSVFSFLFSGYEPAEIERLKQEAMLPP